MVGQILFWNENAKVAIFPTLQVLFVGFQKFYLFLVAWMFFEAWDVKLEPVHSFSNKSIEKRLWILTCLM